VDIAAPRDIELSDQDLPGVFIFNIDDLKNVVNENREKRMKASQEAEKILFEELSGFRSWYLSLNVVPLIKSLRKSFQETLNIEVNKTTNKLSVSEQETIKKLGYLFVNKLLHKPCLELKKLSEEGIAEESIWVLSRLFDLEIEKGKADD
jgi:glutamyl-tRNA reductase